MIETKALNPDEGVNIGPLFRAARNGQIVDAVN